ncbi:hypothetical protein DUNSADRAFT_8266 [Dunaliella salina]|uniref:Uncharacterized protein n=1 Tax=Dunaliella salina TaxID=3046 RepID=A0ABQ7HA76_DUNSA|nr:hypothetical protein DUNSADRAFT_8266 [Dunaliella salina]|eukprot:KAF5843750.1 hypothetical protein DUNSADRAFT_8266 [Dunaliella salina]
MGIDRQDALALALACGGPVAAAGVCGALSSRAIKGWYQKLRKPRWTPPNWLFAPVWTLLYTGQGVASWLVWKNKDGERRLPLTLYGVQLLLNLAWQPLFFNLKRPDVALVDSTAMLGMAAAATATMAQSTPDHKAAIAGLMSPYIGWVGYATALNYRIWKDNPDAHKIAADEPAPPKTA